MHIYSTGYIYIISDWWFGTFFIFPYIGNVIIPSDWYFSGGLKPPTSIYIYTYNIMNVMDMMEYDGYNGYNTIWTNCTTYTHPYLRYFEILMLSSILPPNFLRRCWKRSLHESSEWQISQIWFKRNLPGNEKSQGSGRFATLSPWGIVCMSPGNSIPGMMEPPHTAVLLIQMRGIHYR